MSLHRDVKKMSKMMDEMGLTELKVHNSFLFGVWRKEIHLSKQSAAAAVHQAPAAAVIPAAKPGKSADTQKADATANALKSPMVGIAYLAPEPGAKPFTQIGAKVKAGDTVALIEAMKTFNPVKSDKDGVVKELLVKDGQAVEYDTPLMVIE